MRSAHLLLAGSTLVAMALTGRPALADDAKNPPTGTSSSTSDGGVADIVVTAQRRSESVMAVPLAITALSGDQLANAGIRQITDLQFTTPGYNVADGSGYTQVYIRGVGNNIFVGADPSVATFIDDVPRIYGSLVNDFVDVSRVEVLKGAQGGLYGRNATGGVVNIITRQPNTQHFDAEVRMSYGEYNTEKMSAYFNIPLSDKLAISIAGQRNTHDPYDKNLAPANPYTAAMFTGNSAVGTPAQTASLLNSGVNNAGVNNQNFYEVDGKLLFTPTSDFKITIAGDYAKKNDSNGNSLYTLTPSVAQGLLTGLLTADLGAQVNLPSNFVIGNTPKFTVANGNPGFATLEDYGVSATAVLSLPGVDVTAISAYRHQHTEFLDDLTGADVPVYSAFVDNHKHYYYEELRAISTASGPLHLIGGATYLKTYFGGLTLGNLLTPVPFLQNLPLSGAVTQVKNWSVYGQAAYDFTRSITLSVSGRLIHETNNTLFSDGEAEGATEQKFLPSADLSYKLDGGGNIYARWARGFKSGGVNPVALPAAFANVNSGSIFKGEQVDTYEAGVKVPLAGRKLQLTGDVFYNDYTNLQYQAHSLNPAIIEAILNVGSARTYGVEGALNWRPIKPLTLGVTAGYLNAKYRNFSYGGAGTDYVLTNLSNTQMTNAPKFQLTLTGAVDQPINDKIDFVGNLLITRSSSILWSQSGAPGVIPDASDPGYWLVNARIGVKTPDDQYSIAIFANNLFNTAYTTFGSSSPATGTQDNWGNPRVIGAEFDAKF